MSKTYIDTETCGLHGMPVLLQYAVEDGPITLYEIWRRPVRETLALIERLCTHTVVGFNLAFDWFQIVKVYTVFRLCPLDWVPEEHIEEIAMLEPKGQDGPCIKPVAALDLMLHSRKGPYQSLMARGDIRIKRVPTALAYALARELENRVHFDNIYFARSADPEAPKWQVFDRHDSFGDLDPNFKDVVLKFNPAGGLKFLAEHALKLKPKYHYKDVEPPPAWRPYELGYAPTALTISNPKHHWEVWGYKKTKPISPEDIPVLADVLADEHDDDQIVSELKGGPECKLLGIAWPGVIRKFIDHWATRADAREYATDDVVYTRALDKHFGYPEPGDNDSTLTCMVAAVRWHGFTLNIEGIKALKAGAQAVVAASPVNINKPSEVRDYIMAAMDGTEGLLLEQSTKKANLEAISKWGIGRICPEKHKPDECCPVCNNERFIGEGEPCGKCEGDPACLRCNGTGLIPAGQHPAARRAQEILTVKFANKEIELFDKLLLAGKFHASFVVIGALSSRMAGADGLNAQGIKHTVEVRQMFPLTWGDNLLCGGDFSSFEVTIADAVCNDEALRAELVAGRKIHALFGMAIFPGTTYEEVKASDGNKTFDMYIKGKQGFFGTMLYGGDHSTLINRLGIAEEVAKQAIENFGSRFTGVKKWRKRVADSFCSMTQPGGIGSRVIWKDPADYAETMLGFRRYFTLENRIGKELFLLANKMPKHWKDCGRVVKRGKITVTGGEEVLVSYIATISLEHGVEVRREIVVPREEEKAHILKVTRSNRVQTAGGAVSSALYGAAFSIQAANMRAAANHEIQSPGAEITKHVQRQIWDLQPAGVQDWHVAPFNVHDELMCVTRPDCVKQVTAVVTTAVESFRSKVPLIGMDWGEDIANWADKKNGTIKIRAPEMQ